MNSKSKKIPAKKSPAKKQTGQVTMSRAAFEKIAKRINDYSNNRSSIRGYSAADTGRLRADWTSTNVSTYTEIATALKTLIARSRDAYNNNPYARAIVNIFCSNIICEGIKPTPRVKNKKGEDEQEINAAISGVWDRVNDEIDRTGKQTFYELQHTILKAVILTGGAFINIVKSKPGSLLPIAIQVLDQSALDTTKDTLALGKNSEGKNQILHGIEFNEYLEPVNYHFYGGLGEKSIKVSASNIIHVFKRDLPDQLVGVPWLSPVLPQLYDIDTLVEDTVIASRIQSSAAIWMEKNDEVFPDTDDVDTEDDTLVLEPGAIWRTKSKPEILQASDSVSKVVEPLIKIILHSVAISQGFSYGLLTRDLNNSNFSASRANTSEDRRKFTTDIKWFSKDCCQKVHCVVVKHSIIKNLIPKVSSSLLQTDFWRLSQCSHSTNAWEYVNPLQDVQSDTLCRSNGLLTDQQYFAERGLNYKSVYTQLAKEKKERDELGLTSIEISKIKYDPEEV